MFNLLQKMKFHLITGFGKSSLSYVYDEEGIIGQGVLQGSSSAAPILLLNSEVSLKAYNNNGTGASFTHPITRAVVTDYSVQFVDDTSHFLNANNTEALKTASYVDPSDLLPIAMTNSQLWADLMWVSGGNL